MNIDTILESVVDITRKSLDPAMFTKDDDGYTMKDSVSSFINSVVSEIDSRIVSVNNSFIKGSILSYQWSEDTDVDLLIETGVSKESDRRRIQNIVNDKFSKDIPGTKHPLQIYINIGDYNHDNADGIYDTGKGWIKGPYNIKVNTDDYMAKFDNVVGSIDISTGKLRRDIVDYEMIKKLPKNEIDGLNDMMSSKLNEINKSVDEIVSQFKHIKGMRHEVFRDDMSHDDIVRYGTKNALPENVIFKLLERYWYMSMASDLKDLGRVEDDEIDEIRDAIKSNV